MTEETSLLPARMVNEFVYCPRLFWLEHVEREFASSHDTVDGERIHRRVDHATGELPGQPEPFMRDVTSVELSSERLGIVAKIDIVRPDGAFVIPVDYKRGKRPSLALGAYEPERVQIALQAMLLRENGYAVERGKIYYAASKEYVDVAVDSELEALALRSIDGARTVVQRTSIPPPLRDSPKCGRCSLHAICLPDETNAVRDRDEKPVRPFAAGLADEVAVYVTEAGARVGLSGEVLEVRTDAGVVADARLLDVGTVSLFGNVQISSQAMRALMQREVPVLFLSYGGWLSGVTRAPSDHSLDLRIAQHAYAQDDLAGLGIARAIVEGKVRNQRTMIRRGLGREAAPTLRALSLLIHRIPNAKDRDQLLGLEGSAARQYFECFGEMLKIATGFELAGRNRRPPTDPINALLSFGYAMLLREAIAAAYEVGLEPGLGVYHRVRPGRPAMALDLVEEFRPLIVDSTVLTVINSRELRASHFDRRGAAIVLTDEGRRQFIRAIERRLRTTIRHPIFGYEVTYRRGLRIQARLLARTLQGDLAAYPAFATR